MAYKSKNIIAAVKYFISKVDRTFLEVHVKNLVKVTKTGEVIGRKRPLTLRKSSFKFCH